jgi:hypothetical protein
MRVLKNMAEANECTAVRLTDKRQRGPFNHAAYFLLKDLPVARNLNQHPV